MKRFYLIQMQPLRSTRVEHQRDQLRHLVLNARRRPVATAPPRGVAVRARVHGRLAWAPAVGARAPRALDETGRRLSQDPKIGEFGTGIGRRRQGSVRAGAA